jgi:uncharacterized membrane protein YGL010W
MKTLLFKSIAIFFILLVGTSVMMDVMQTEFGTVNYWDRRGIFFLIFITFFPRLTLLFSSVAFGGVFWWLGFIFLPRILVAALATVSYFHTNPVLVVISWLVAFGGEVFEKRGLGRGSFVIKTYRPGRPPYQDDSTSGPVIGDDGVIEAEFTKKD